MAKKSEALYDAMRLSPRQIDQLRTAIRRGYVEAYQNEVRQQLSNAGISAPARYPSGDDAALIEVLVDRDVSSIIDTYEKELRNKIQRMIQDNPQLNLIDAQRDLRVWEVERNAYKNNQIARATRTNGAEYARDRFYNENNIQTNFIWDASPPIVRNSHQECIRRVRAGAVSVDEARGWSKTHPNCRHKKRPVTQPQLDRRRVWRG